MLEGSILTPTTVLLSGMTRESFNRLTAWRSTSSSNIALGGMSPAYLRTRPWNEHLAPRMGIRFGRPLAVRNSGSVNQPSRTRAARLRFQAGETTDDSRRLNSFLTSPLL